MGVRLCRAGHRTALVGALPHHCRLAVLRLYRAERIDAVDQYGFITGGWQITVGVGLILLTLEMARRAVSWPLPLITFLFLLYGLFGSHIPGEFGHPGLPFNSFLGTLVITEGGLWGKPTGVSVSVVAVFVIFGAVLNAGEAGQGFMNIAIAAAGRLKGGAAKVSVLSSALSARSPVPHRRTSPRRAW